MRETFRAYRTTLGFGFRAAPWQASLQWLTGIVVALAGPVLAYGGKLLVDAAVDGDLERGLTAAAVVAVVLAALLVAGVYHVDLVFAVVERTEALADQRLMWLLGGAHGLAHFERPDYLDQVQRIREERLALANTVNATSGVLRVTVTLAVSAVLLAGVHPGLLALALLGGVSLVIGRRIRDVRASAQEVSSEDERLRRHLFDIGTEASPGKELRIFGVTDTLLRRHHDVSDRVLGHRNRADWRAARLQTVDAAVTAGGFLAAIVVVLLLALDGRASPGDVVLVIGLALELGAAVGTAVAYGDVFLWGLRLSRRLVWLEDYATSTTKTPADPAPVPPRLDHGIDLAAVTFGYPGTDRPVLQDVSLHLPAGAVVALVGENGAGKTTLVKLLCDFYQPDHGQILVDGVDLAQIPTDRWRSRVSAAFQDYASFEFLTRETVGVADLNRTDDESVLGALARADATTLIGQLPHGLDTQLGARWDGGLDLSGGQWQKLALARGLLRTQPLLIVFDEPTAALDAPTEHALFERFAAASRSAQQQGAVTLLVSHRFSTVRMADLIVVLDQGRVRETGTHHELIDRDDLYAELYELQSRAYR